MSDAPAWLPSRFVRHWAQKLEPLHFTDFAQISKNQKMRRVGENLKI
jgi:hypothetical protein